MSRLCLLAAFLFLLPFFVKANNIRIDSVSYTSTSVGEGQTTLYMTFTVVWENSWRDDYNYDAAYVFFKFKRKDTDPRQPQEWHHLFLKNDGNAIEPGFTDDYDYWLSPLSSAGTDFNTGIYIFRKGDDVWDKDSVRVKVAWNVENQMVAKQLTTDDIRNGNIDVVGHAIEMVYVPRGAYRIGDGVSTKGFHRQAFPILAEYDLISRRYKYDSSNGTGDTTAVYAADRVNDNTGNALSEWVATGSGPWWWSVDFGKDNYKRITYFGVNSAPGAVNYPTRFALLGTLDPDITNVKWDTLWAGSGKEYWIAAKDAYPVEKAIPVTRPGNYRSYKLVVLGMNTGVPSISTVGMTEKDLRSLIDYSVLIDSPVTEIDSVRKLGASDGTVWVSGEKLPASFPNGYRGFYAMKYELSQDQYVRFLNKLTYQQQNGLLNGRLDDLEEGDYIFGDRERANERNGIILATKIQGLPAVFACDLDGDKVPGQSADGMNIACNFMNIQDMLAYADWACLRPLSEMEYEKMCRPFYPSIPVKGSFAWGTTKLEAPGGLTNAGTQSERAERGNANFGDPGRGPLRVGAFAQASSPGLVQGGAGFWGCMDLCGNLSEMYYNVNYRGLVLVDEQGSGSSAAGHESSHGDGSLSGDGRYNGVKSKHWSDDPEAMSLRGGSFASDTAVLRVSDRTWHTGYFKNILERDSTVTFRLGRTAPAYPEIVSWLVTENEVTTEGTNRNDFFLNTPSYIIKGNEPENPQGGLISYIWYSQESGGEWKVMEGETNRDLFFDKYRTDTIVTTVNGLNFNFKRKAITPFTDSETSSEYLVNLIANPFDKAVETFSNVNGANNTYQVACSWEASIPRKWGFDKEYPGLTIDAEKGIISGLTAVVCNVTVTLECPLHKGIIYKKRVRETERRYNYRNSPYTIKLCPGTYQFDCYGAAGGPATYTGKIGGYGGRALGNYTATAVQTFYLYVGGMGATSGAAGWNGGGASYANTYCGSGGGATDIRTVSGAWNNATSLANRILVGGGGGGASYYYNGAAGGGTNGANGSYMNGAWGRGGTQTTAGQNGGFGYGGNTPNGNYNGGGGGGYYGGGGGNNGHNGAGGGGSGYINGTVIKNGTMYNGQNGGNGYIIIRPL